MEMTKRKLKLQRTLVTITLSVLTFGIIFAPVVLAQDDLIGGQDPNTTLNQIFEPFERFINWILELVENIILHLFDWDWIRGFFTGIFGAIDGWIESITGNNLGGIFRIIGHTLSDVFNFVINLLKDLWPF